MKGERPASHLQRPMAKSRSRTDGRLFFLDERDVAAAFETRDFDLGKLFFAVEPKVLTDVFLGDVVAAHVARDQLTVSDKLARLSLDQATETLRIVGSECHQSMETDDDCAAAESREERGAAVDGASKDRREDYEESVVERAFFRKGPLIAETNDDEREDHHDHSAQRNLSES